MDCICAPDSRCASSTTASGLPPNIFAVNTSTVTYRMLIYAPEASGRLQPEEVDVARCPPAVLRAPGSHRAEQQLPARRTRNRGEALQSPASARNLPPTLRQ